MNDKSWRMYNMECVPVCECVSIRWHRTRNGHQNTASRCIYVFYRVNATIVSHLYKTQSKYHLPNGINWANNFTKTKEEKKHTLTGHKFRQCWISADWVWNHYSIRALSHSFTHTQLLYMSELFCSHSGSVWKGRVRTSACTRKYTCERNGTKRLRMSVEISLNVFIDVENGM